MQELRNQYLADAHGNDREAMAAMAADLMEGDAARFKAGYSEENAVLAVADVFAVDADVVRQAVEAARRYEAGPDR